jgi:hypothetical protein
MQNTALHCSVELFCRLSGASKHSACRSRRTCPPHSVLPFGPSDGAAADPGQNFARRRLRRHGAVRRPVTEFFAILVASPARIVLALLADERQLGHPPHALVGVGRSEHSSAVAIDERQMALTEDDGVGPRLWQKTAVLAGFTGRAQRAALAAFDQTRKFLLIALSVCRVLSTLGDIQGPFDSILKQPMAKNGAAVVDQDQIGLARCYPQPAPSHLPKQTDLLGWSSEDDATDGREVEALGQHHTVADELGLAGRQTGENSVAFGLRRCAIDVFGAHLRLQKLIFDVDRMRDVDAEHQGLPSLAVSVPVGDDVADQIVAVHAIGKLLDDVIPLPGLDTLQIGSGRRVIDRGDQTAPLDQFGDLRTFDKLVKEVAQSSPITPTWRGR